MLLFALLLTIFSGGLWLIDLICAALAFWFFYQAKKDAPKESKPFHKTKVFVLFWLILAAWAISIIARSWGL